MAITKTYVDSRYTRGNRKRIEQDEKELEKLMGKTSEDEAEEQEEEPKAREVPEVKEEEEPSDPEEKSFKKRYGDLRRHLSEKEKEWEAKFAQISNTSSKSVLPPKSDEDIAAWAAKYPDVAAIVETIANKKAEEKLSSYKNKFEEYEKISYETARAKAMNAIRAAHDDFDDLKKSDEFHQWADEQPKWVQDALYENEEDARAVVRVLDLYKIDKGLTVSAKKEKSKEAASLVATKSKANMDFDDSGTKLYESQVAKMDMNTYAKNETKIMEAIRKGTFVYDLSGGAR